MLNVVVLLAVLASSWARPPAVPDSAWPPTPKAETLALDPANAHYGIVFTGDRVDRRHRIINRGDQPVTLLKLKSFRSGPSPQLPRYGQVLQPGEATFVDLSLDGGSRPRKLTRSFQLLASGRSNPKPERTRVQAISFTAVAWDPYGLPDRGPTLVTLRSIDGSPFSVKSSYPPDAIRVVDRPSPTTIVVEATADGRQRSILVRLDHPHCKKITIPVPWDDHPASKRPPAAFPLNGEIAVITPNVEAGFVFVDEELVVIAGVFNGTSKPVMVDAAPELQIAKSYQVESGDIVPVAITVRGEEPGELNLAETIRVGGEQFTVRVHATVVERPVVSKPPPPPTIALVQTPEDP